MVRRGGVSRVCNRSFLAPAKAGAYSALSMWMTQISSSPPRLTACRGRLQRGPILTLSNMDSRLRGNDEFGVTRHPFIQSSIVGQRSVRVFAAHTSCAPLKNEPRVDELRFVPGDNGVEQAGAA